MVVVCAARSAVLYGSISAAMAAQRLRPKAPNPLLLYPFVNKRSLASEFPTCYYRRASACCTRHCAERRLSRTRLLQLTHLGLVLRVFSACLSHVPTRFLSLLLSLTAALSA